MIINVRLKTKNTFWDHILFKKEKQYIVDEKINYNAQLPKNTTQANDVMWNLVCKQQYVTNVPNILFLRRSLFPICNGSKILYNHLF